MKKRLPNGKTVEVLVGAELELPKHKTLFDEGVAAQIIDAYMRGGTMKEIGSMPGMRPVEVIYFWMQNQAGFRAKMKEARKLRGMYFEEKALEHAEDAKEFDVQSRRLKVETMKWAAEVNDRETYGKSTKLLGDANQPIAFIIDTGIHRPELDVPPTDAISLPNLNGPAPTEGGQ